MMTWSVYWRISYFEHCKISNRVCIWMLLWPGQLRTRPGAKIRTVKFCIFRESLRTALSSVLCTQLHCAYEGTVLYYVVDYVKLKSVLCSPGTGHSSSLLLIGLSPPGTVLLIVLCSHVQNALKCSVFSYVLRSQAYYTFKCIVLYSTVLSSVICFQVYSTVL